jgi:hypothetical protein
MFQLCCVLATLPGANSACMAWPDLVLGRRSGGSSRVTGDFYAQPTDRPTVVQKGPEMAAAAASYAGGKGVGFIVPRKVRRERRINSRQLRHFIARHRRRRCPCNSRDRSGWKRIFVVSGLSGAPMGALTELVRGACGFLGCWHTYNVCKKKF